MSHRFHCPELPPSGPARLEGDDARHLARVLRLQPGQAVELFDGQSSLARAATITRLGRDTVELELTGDPIPGREPEVDLTLACALPKGERLDWLVEKAVELGVTRLAPVLTERSVVDPRPAKLQRLRRAVIEASKQCGRNRLMRLDEPAPFAAVLAIGSDSERLLAHPGGTPLLDLPASPPGSAVVLLVGPEGGFSETEVGQAEASGWTRLALGPTLLRIETAALAATALLLASGRGRRQPPVTRIEGETER